MIGQLIACLRVPSRKLSYKEDAEQGLLIDCGVYSSDLLIGPFHAYVHQMPLLASLAPSPVKYGMCER